jgi:hypothetical protein
VESRGSEERNHESSESLNNVNEGFQKSGFGNSGYSGKKSPPGNFSFIGFEDGNTRKEGTFGDRRNSANSDGFGNDGFGNSGFGNPGNH